MLYEPSDLTEVQKINLYILGEPFDNSWDWSNPVPVEFSDPPSITQSISTAEIQLRFGLFDINKHAHSYFSWPTIT